MRRKTVLDLCDQYLTGGKVTGNHSTASLIKRLEKKKVFPVFPLPIGTRELDLLVMLFLDDGSLGALTHSCKYYSELATVQHFWRQRLSILVEWPIPLGKDDYHEQYELFSEEKPYDYIHCAIGYNYLPLVEVLLERFKYDETGGKMHPLVTAAGNHNPSFFNTILAHPNGVTTTKALFDAMQQSLVAATLMNNEKVVEILLERAEIDSITVALSCTVAVSRGHNSILARFLPRADAHTLAKARFKIFDLALGGGGNGTTVVMLFNAITAVVPPGPHGHNKVRMHALTAAVTHIRLDIIFSMLNAGIYTEGDYPSLLRWTVFSLCRSRGRDSRPKLPLDANALIFFETLVNTIGVTANDCIMAFGSSMMARGAAVPLLGILLTKFEGVEGVGKKTVLRILPLVLYYIIASPDATLRKRVMRYPISVWRLTKTLAVAFKMLAKPTEVKGAEKVILYLTKGGRRATPEQFVELLREEHFDLATKLLERGSYSPSKEIPDLFSCRRLERWARFIFGDKTEEGLRDILRAAPSLAPYFITIVASSSSFGKLDALPLLKLLLALSHLHNTNKEYLADCLFEVCQNGIVRENRKLIRFALKDIVRSSSPARSASGEGAHRGPLVAIWQCILVLRGSKEIMEAVLDFAPPSLLERIVTLPLGQCRNDTFAKNLASLLVERYSLDPELLIVTAKKNRMKKLVKYLSEKL